MKFMLLHADRRGVTSIEYAIIASMIALVIISSVTLLGKNLNNSFNNVGTAFTAAPAQTPAPAPAPTPAPQTSQD